MSFITYIIDLFLHLDVHLAELVNTAGVWTFVLLFFVIFMETGFVITPFLPGDSLLFAAGSLAALESSHLNVGIVYIVVTLAAVLGDTANYWVGHMVGPRVFTEKVRFLKKEYLDRTHDFYERHGRITIFLARFVPIIRTFAPFVAGIGNMSYIHFISYNIFGGICWTALFLFGGYFFGNIAFVKDHFSLVIVAIILISAIPAVSEVIKSRKPKIPEES